MEKTFTVKFVIEDNQIRTEMHNHKVNKQEALGLLDMAKSQILGSLKEGRQEVFKSEFKKEE
ncbi:MAG: hypothetical protein V1914_03345 [archaeon]